MIKYKIPTGFKVIAYNSTETLSSDEEYHEGVILKLIVSAGNSHDKDIFDKWTPVQLSEIGISKIDDPSYDINRYDLTGTPNDTVQLDGSYLRDYVGALTEKSGYIETLRNTRTNECISSCFAKIQEGYTYDDGTLYVLLKATEESVQDFNLRAKNIESADYIALKFEDYNGVVIDSATTTQITAISTELNDYYLKIEVKKTEHLKTIEDADRSTLDGMTSFPWIV